MACGSLEVRVQRRTCSSVVVLSSPPPEFAGAILEEVTQEGEDPKIKGSIMLAFAASKDEVLKALQEDIYFKEYVWDWHNVQIHPVYRKIPLHCTQSVPLTAVSSNLHLGSLFRAPMSSLARSVRAQHCLSI